MLKRLTLSILSVSTILTAAHAQTYSPRQAPGVSAEMVTAAKIVFGKSAVVTQTLAHACVIETTIANSSIRWKQINLVMLDPSKARILSARQPNHPNIVVYTLNVPGDRGNPAITNYDEKHDPVDFDVNLSQEAAVAAITNAGSVDTLKILGAFHYLYKQDGPACRSTTLLN